MPPGGTSSPLAPNQTNVSPTVPNAIGVTGSNLVFNSIHGVTDANSAIVWGEYYVDTDPGQGRANSFPMNKATLNDCVEGILYAVDSSALSVGNHQVGIRLKTLNGSWSQTRLFDLFVYVDQKVTIPPKAQVANAEFIYDNTGSPGFGRGLALNAAYKGTELGDLPADTIDTSALATGSQLLNVRFSDLDGNWGQTQNWYFTVAPASSTLNLVNLNVQNNIGVSYLNFNSAQLQGTTLTLQVPRLFTWNGTLYANWGYVGQGSAPSSISSQQATFTINNASTLTWVWGDLCQIVSTSIYGSVSGPGNWSWYADPDPSNSGGIGTYAQDIRNGVVEGDRSSGGHGRTIRHRQTHACRVSDGSRRGQ